MQACQANFEASLSGFYNAASLPDESNTNEEISNKIGQWSAVLLLPECTLGQVFSEPSLQFQLDSLCIESK